eukprot:13794577-Ditylum_brightwellii.AAC.1
MGHPQPPTPIQVDNAVAHGIVNNNIRKHKTKAIDMRLYWVQDQVKQKQFIMYWETGSNNKADYFAKHHPSENNHKMIGNLESRMPNSGKKTFHKEDPETHIQNSEQRTLPTVNLMQAKTYAR